jgi:hypothetical protein
MGHGRKCTGRRAAAAREPVRTVAAAVPPFGRSRLPRLEAPVREGSALVEHLVALRLKPTTTEAQVEELLSAVRGLPAKVPGILELRCGRNFSPERAHGYDIGIRVLFPGRAELAAYGPHPEHLPVRARIAELCADVLAVDFEA